MLVYHYTDSARLPHIALSGAVKPGANRIGGFPDPDFVWATSSPVGDRTASGGMHDAYRAGRVRLVRIAFDSEHFFPWAEAPRRFPVWEQRFVEALEISARGKGDPRLWWCRDGAIGLNACEGIETRSYADRRWLPLEGEIEVLADPREGGMWAGVEIQGTVHASMLLDDGRGAVGYRFESFPAKRREPA